MSGYQIAQLNVGRAVAPLDDPRLAGFVARLDEINGLAQMSPGFVWRLQGSSGNATDVRIDDDPRVIVNLTVWDSPDSLFAFAYRSDHRTVLARRSEWFERWNGPSVVLWWQPSGTIPTIEDAVRRLRLLADLGPTAEAFTFRERFLPPASVPGQAPPASSPA